MLPIPRHIANQITLASRAFGAVVVTGPRRSGKTWLLRRLFPKAQYFLFEDPDVIGRFRSDPQGFLDDVRTPAIFDEIQNVPELFNYVRTRIDEHPSKKGQWLLTGSQEASLMKNVSESMAGRAAIFQLMPISTAESSKVSVLRGGYPEVLARPKTSALWFSSYVQTYIERDVRSASQIQDLPKFRRMMALLATRHGQLLNRSELAAPIGTSVPTISHWIDILEASGLILVVPPYFNNFGKRLLKTPKIYWTDSGLLCHLLGIESESQLNRSPFLGPIFEGFVALEIVKAQVNAGRRKEVYFFRDQQGLEVDFIAPTNRGNMALLEVKATRTPLASMAKPMLQLLDQWKKEGAPAPNLEAWLVHRPALRPLISDSLSPGVRLCVPEKLSAMFG